ncbi:hypothetical protein GJAV_G00100200 [Gymnothorax javanicus]|nr:hypothetical protein GJAV_G00100200 [Gymnothorax javanicus]
MSVKAGATVDFLKKASICYRDICPEQSRFLMRLQQHMKAETEPDEVLCPFCFQWRHAHDYRVRIKPKRKPSLLIQKILKLEAAHVRLSPEQLKTLRRFQKACNTLMATCHTCNKTSKSCGVGRDTVRALSKTQNTLGSQEQWP